MPFTPDEELELLFDPALIPNDVKAQLPEHLHMRPLASSDHSRSHLQLLSILSTAPALPESTYTSLFGTLKSTPNTYYTLVIISKSSDQIVGVGNVFIERKFLRNAGKVGHIEDIAVDKNVQGAKLGLRIIQALTGISEAQGAYKTILNCSTANIPFYQKCGYAEKEHEMAKYAAGITHVSKL